MNAPQLNDLNYKHLKHFHAVAMTGSLTAAAKELGLASSTLSEQIKAFENWIGRSLFERNRDGLALNDEGRRVLRYSSSIFEQGQRLTKELRDLPDTAVPVISIGVAPSIAQAFAAKYFLPLFLADGQMPRIVSDGHLSLVKRLMKLELDIVLSDTVPSDTERVGIESTELYSHPLHVVAAPAMASGVSELPGDLEGRKVISYPAGSTSSLLLDEYFESSRIHMKSCGETDSVDVMGEVAKQGLAFAFVPPHVVESDVKSGLLKDLGPLPGHESKVHGLYNRRDVPARIRAAIDALTQI